ncbi:MAG TPA: carboxylate/amino acid/amine transporter [Alcanivoracaceae bacterium]|nr:carboxylate/amino acid/amine transporter [Alcanivoracaceae bacterium]
MPYLIIVTLLWALSFNFIGAFLANQVDSYFAVLTRVVLALAVFLPMTRFRAVPRAFMWGVALCGALQFGVTYLGLYLSFNLLTVPEVLLFTVLTPLHITLINDALEKRFNPWALLAAALAVFGAVVIRAEPITEDYLTGFVLLQVANASFAAGMVGYKHLVRRYPSSIPLHQRFGYFFLGALAVVLPAWLLLGDPQGVPQNTTQWGVLLWMGLLATALGQFWWNKGATMVSGGTLAVMNNVSVPLGILINVVFWQAELDAVRFAIGAALIVGSLLFIRRRQHA